MTAAGMRSTAGRVACETIAAAWCLVALGACAPGPGEHGPEGRAAPRGKADQGGGSTECALSVDCAVDRVCLDGACVEPVQRDRAPGGAAACPSKPSMGAACTDDSARCGPRAERRYFEALQARVVQMLGQALESLQVHRTLYGEPFAEATESERAIAREHRAAFVASRRAEEAFGAALEDYGWAASQAQGHVWSMLRTGRRDPETARETIERAIDARRHLGFAVTTPQQATADVSASSVPYPVSRDSIRSTVKRERCAWPGRLAELETVVRRDRARLAALLATAASTGPFSVRVELEGSLQAFWNEVREQLEDRKQTLAELRDEAEQLSFSRDNLLDLMETYPFARMTVLAEEGLVELDRAIWSEHQFDSAKRKLLYAVGLTAAYALGAYVASSALLTYATGLVRFLRTIPVLSRFVPGTPGAAAWFNLATGVPYYFAAIAGGSLYLDWQARRDARARQSLAESELSDAEWATRRRERAERMQRLAESLATGERTVPEVWRRFVGP